LALATGRWSPELDNKENEHDRTRYLLVVRPRRSQQSGGVLRQDVSRQPCPANADTIRTALDLLIDRLGDLRADLGRGEVMETVFTDAAKWRGEVMKTRE
jgi:hypothetical protein